MKLFDTQLKRQSFLVGMLVILLFVDQGLKLWVIGSEVNWTSALADFTFYANTGLSFGPLSDTDPVIRVILFSTIFAILAMILLILIFLFFNRKDFFWLQVSLMSLLAGAAGNTLDKVRLGYVVEVLVFKASFLKGITLSLSDIWIGIGLIGTFACLIVLNKKLWFLNNVRQFQIIEKDFQVNFSLKLTFVSFMSGIVLGLFSYALINVIIPDSDMKSQALIVFAVGWFFLNLLLASVTFIFGLLLSHRTSGPLYALYVYVLDLVEGNTTTFQLRQRDHHKEILYEIVSNLLKLKK